jgi:Raf kinase inhibitor-like YbhB/YbcL family protein
MRLTTTGFEVGGVIPDKYALARPEEGGPVALSDNVNPHLEWDGVPDGTRSFAIICHDPDVPSRPDDVNKEDREVPSDLPRVDFFHWVVVDLPPTLTGIDEGEFANGVVPRGQQVAAGPYGCRQGLNDYTGWFAGDPDMEGKYYGYDGPAPPWNDSIIHNYVFTLFALDVERLDLPEDFTGSDVREAMEGHILASASVSGTYTQNDRLR